MNDPPTLRGDGGERLAELETRSEIRPASFEPRPPDPKLGPYRLLRLLGRGGMGEVFLAHDENLDRPVAVKRIRPEGGQSETERRRFQREAKAAARLSHSAIVHVYDLGSDPSGGDYLVLEYVAGETLAERLARGPLEPAFAVARAAEIAEGLAAAHEAGFLHRDLKAGNVMLTPDGHAKILDFGLVRPLEAAGFSGELTQQSVLVGTCHAMSPEQAAGGELDARSDLFALGSLLYEMLTATAPFRGANPLDSLRRVAEATPRPLCEIKPQLPPELARLVAELLAKRREDRPASAREVAARLAALAPLLGSTASGVASWPPRPRPLPLPWRRRGLVTAAACLAGALLGTFALFARPAPLRVAVPSPHVDAGSAGDPELAFATSAALSSALSTLASLEGVSPIDPREADRGSADRGRPSPVQVARVTAADDVLLISLVRQGGGGRVTLRRAAADGRVVASLDLPFAIRDLHGLADAVAAYLLKLYPDRRWRGGGGPQLRVRDPDYAEFLAIRARVEGGQAVAPDFARLEAIVETSPDFLEPYLLAARIGRFLLRNQGEPRYQEEVHALIEEARRRFPDDPRPLRELFQLEVERRRLEEAREILGTLEELLPGNPELLPLRAQLLLEEGRTQDALALRLAAALHAPSWQNLYRLADLEARLNQLPAARRHFAAVIAEDPQNPWALEKLAEIEVYYGDLSHAQQIYHQVARQSGRYQSYINIGFVRHLQGDYRGAVAAYRHALGIQKDYFVALYGLAEAQTELGLAAPAAGNFQRALRQIEQQAALSGLRPDEVMFQAKCLARLGRTDEAVTLTQKMLRQSANEPEILFDAAEVYNLVGDRHSALSHARAALAGGISRRLFTGSAWQALAPDLDRLRPP